MKLIEADTWSKTTPAHYAAELIVRYKSASWIVPYFSMRTHGNEKAVRFAKAVLRELDKAHLIRTTVHAIMIAGAANEALSRPVEELMIFSEEVRNMGSGKSTMLIFDALDFLKAISESPPRE